MTWKNGGAVVKTWNYSYDPGGRLTGLSSSWGENFSWVYDGEGKLKQQINSNHTSDEYTYNEARGWPTRITHKSWGTPFAQYDLVYDNGANTVGNLTGVQELDGSTVVYSYDPLSRLTGEVRTGTNPFSHSYGYDLAGNRTNVDGWQYAFDGANKFIGNGTYDGDGNILSDPATEATSFTWNPVSQLSAINEWAQYGTYLFHDYDGFGRRFLTRKDEIFLNSNFWALTFSIYDGDLPIGSITINPNVPNGYVTTIDWGAAGLISSGGETFHFGPQGETRVITDWSGAVTNSCLYTAYGVPVATTANWWPAFGFGGQFGYWTDNNSRQYYGPTGLILCGARWYSPKQGRWLSRDPIGYSGGSNLYAYCQSNPIGLVDPSGLQGGHHYVVGPIRNLTGLSNAAKRVFNATVGSTEPVHGWSVEHVRYNDRVARIWDVFLRRRSIKNIGTITEAQAQEFISWIRNSKHPDIVDFLAREERMAAETAARRAAVAAENACTESASIGSKAARATGLLLIVAPYAYYEGKLQAMAESGVKRDHRLLIQSDRQMLDWKDEERQDEEKLLRGIFVGRYKGRK